MSWAWCVPRAAEQKGLYTLQCPAVPPMRYHGDTGPKSSQQSRMEVATGTFYHKLLQLAAPSLDLNKNPVNPERPLPPSSQMAVFRNWGYLTGVLMIRESPLIIWGSF